MTLSLLHTLASEPTRRLREHCSHHGVTSVRALLASIIAKAHHRKHFEQFGLLGAAVGPVVPTEMGFRLNTELGSIEIQDFKPTSKVSYLVTVQFVGLQINETNETYDEPYVVVGVVSLAPELALGGQLDQLVASQLVQVPGEDHSAGYVFPDTQTIWRQGQLIGGTGIKITAFAYEEDSGDPDEVAEAINDYLREKVQQGAQAIGNAYQVGAEATAVANSPELQFLLTGISLGLAGWMGDDEVGYKSLELRLSEIKELAAIPPDDFPNTLLTGPGGMKYNRSFPVGDDGEGRYTVYFRVSAVRVEGIDVPEPATP